MSTKDNLIWYQFVNIIISQTCNTIYRTKPSHTSSGNAPSISIKFSVLPSSFSMRKTSLEQIWLMPQTDAKNAIISYILKSMKIITFQSVCMCVCVCVFACVCVTLFHFTALKKGAKNLSEVKLPIFIFLSTIFSLQFLLFLHTFISQEFKLV